MNDSQRKRGNIFNEVGTAHVKLEIVKERSTLEVRAKTTKQQQSGRKKKKEESKHEEYKGFHKDSKNKERQNLFNSKSTTTYQKQGNQNYQLNVKDQPVKQSNTEGDFEVDKKLLDFNIDEVSESDVSSNYNSFTGHQPDRQQYYQSALNIRKDEQTGTLEDENYKSMLAPKASFGQILDLQNINIKSDSNMSVFSQPRKESGPQTARSYVDLKGDQTIQGNQLKKQNTVQFSIVESDLNPKEERIKTQLANHLSDQILYDRVIPTLIKDIFKESQQDHLEILAQQKKSQEQLSKVTESYFNDDLLQNVLRNILREAFSLNTQAGTKAILEYIDEEIIEQVNFELGSKIWNDCLLLPKIVNEDHTIVVKAMVDQQVRDLIEETLLEEAQAQQMKLTPKQSSSTTNLNSSPPRHLVSTFASLDAEIWKYIEDNLVLGHIYDQIEDLAIVEMQQILFNKHKIPEQISEEIYSDMLRKEIKQQLQTVIRKERVLAKSAENQFILQLKEEIKDIVKECQIESKAVQQQQDCQHVDAALDQLTDQFVENQLRTLLSFFVETSVQSQSQETQLLSKISDNLLINVQTSQIPQIILECLSLEQDSQQVAQTVSSQVLHQEATQIMNECLEQELMRDQIDGLVDRIIENHIWRETVKDFQQHNEAQAEVMTDLIDHLTQEFFSDNFAEIKNEYLKQFKEQIKGKEESQFSIIKLTQLDQSTSSLRQLKETPKYMNLSQTYKSRDYSSVNSSKFMDCYDDTPGQQQLFSQEAEEFKGNSSLILGSQLSQIESVQPLHQQRQEYLNETMTDFGADIEEGYKSTNYMIRDYYVNSRIKSIAFLNLGDQLRQQQLQRMSGQNRPQRVVRQDRVLPIDALAVDVLCVNCYECIKVDNADAHSLECEKALQLKKKQGKQGKSKMPIDTSQMGESTTNSGLMRADNLYLLGQASKGYNFDEGRYDFNDKVEQEMMGQEEREQISEINERIFKLHKAIKQKQIEEQSKPNQDLGLMRYLDDFETLAINIFTNNTNKEEVESHTAELLEKIKYFRPVSGIELSLNITARRLAQLSLQKADLLDQYQQLYHQDDSFNYDRLSHIEPDSEDYYNQDLSNNPNQNCVTYTRSHTYQHQLSPDSSNKLFFSEGRPHSPFNEEHFHQLEEESKQQKAELEIWRNLHNEMLKNYLMTKANPQNKLTDINSDVSGNSNYQSEGLSSNTSIAGSSSIGGFMGSPLKSRRQSSRPSIDDVAQLDEVEETLKHKQTEDLKRYFYTIAIHTSKKVLKSIPQGSTLKALYQKCSELEVPVSEWEHFIQKELTQAK